ncbi:MAG: hypothetical protein AAGB93_00640 [Planctomycetota bacterium]
MIEILYDRSVAIEARHLHGVIADLPVSLRSHSRALVEVLRDVHAVHDWRQMLVLVAAGDQVIIHVPGAEATNVWTLTFGDFGADELIAVARKYQVESYAPPIAPSAKNHDLGSSRFGRALQGRWARWILRPQLHATVGERIANADALIRRARRDGQRSSRWLICKHKAFLAVWVGGVTARIIGWKTLDLMKAILATMKFLDLFRGD